MLGFHDANEVKTWQCAAGSLGAAPDLRPPPHQDQSDPPPIAFIHQGLLCPGMSLTLCISYNPRWSRDVGCRGKFCDKSQGRVLLQKIRPPSSYSLILF